MLFPVKQRICPSARPDLCLATISPGGRANGWNRSIWERQTPSGRSWRASPPTSSYCTEKPSTRRAAAAEGSPPSRAPSLSTVERRSLSGSLSLDSCAPSSPSSARPSCSASPTRRPSSGGTACSPRYPATRTVPCCATPSGSTRGTSTTRPLQRLREAPQARPIPPEALRLRRHRHLK